MATRIQVNKIVSTATGLWEKISLVGEESVSWERRAGEEETRLRQRYDGGAGGNGSEGFRVEGERWWIASSHAGRPRLLEWARLLQQTADKENIELGVIVWGTSGLQEPTTTSTIRAQLTTTLDLNEVSSIIEANMYPEGLLEGRIVWGEGLAGDEHAAECKGHPVPISKVVDGMGSISSFCQPCWDWSDFHKHRSWSLPMDFMTKRGIFNTRLARPDKAGLRGKLTEEELEKVLATYVKGRLSPGPDGIISELLKEPPRSGT